MGENKKDGSSLVSLKRRIMEVLEVYEAPKLISAGLEE